MENTNYLAIAKSVNLHTAERWLQFKAWLEDTPLFRAIQSHAGTGLIIESLPNEFRLKLNGISKIDKAEDLPIELIQNFYINSPFFINDTDYSQQQTNKNHEQHHESTDREALW